MDKKMYDRIKMLRKKRSEGTASFAERNWLNMQEKLIAKRKWLAFALDQMASKGANGPRA